MWVELVSSTPSRTRPTIETEHRKLYSGAVSGQWKPNSDFQTDVDVLVTRLDVDYDEFGLDIYPDDTTFATPQFVAGSQKVVGDTVVAATINNVRWMASRETSLNRHDLAVFGIKQAWTPGAWAFNAEYGYSRARSYHPDGKATTRDRIAFFGPLTYDFSRGYKSIPQLTTSVEAPTKPTASPRYFDELAIGDSYELGSLVFTPQEIVAFARSFDPQPFHMDEEAARKSSFGSLCASGWHTAAGWMAAMVSSRRFMSSSPMDGGRSRREVPSTFERMISARD